jgi:hypothetical protein
LEKQLPTDLCRSANDSYKAYLPFLEGFQNLTIPGDAILLNLAYLRVKTGNFPEIASLRFATVFICQFEAK